MEPNMAELKMPVRHRVSYDDDFNAWTLDQAARLRRERPRTIDWENLAEEVESLGRSDKRALGSGLKVVLEHLIKWRYQPEKRSESWSDSIEEHRDRIARIIADSPSLAGWPAEVLAAEYSRARRKALKDTKLPPPAIPVACPFSIKQALDADYLPS
jgi:hypothetical protein